MPNTANFAIPDPPLLERIANGMALVAFSLCIMSPLAISYLWLVQWLQPDYSRTLHLWTESAGSRPADRFVLASIGCPAVAFALAFSSMFFKSTQRAMHVMLLCVGCFVLTVINGLFFNY